MKENLKKKNYDLSFYIQDEKIIITRKKRRMKISISILILYLFYLIFTTLMQLTFLSSEIINSLLLFLIFLGFTLLKEGKEEIEINDFDLVIKRYFLNLCYFSKKIPKNNIKTIFFENLLEADSFTSVFCLEMQLLKNMHFRIKYKDFEDKIISYGIDLTESEYLEIIENLKKFFSDNRVEIL